MRDVRIRIETEDAERASRWYSDVLAWEPLDFSPEEGWVLLRMTGGDHALLANRDAWVKAAGRWASPAVRRLEPGERLYLSLPEEGDAALNRLEARLQAAGAKYRDESEPGCWRTLAVDLPEGGIAAYWQELFPPMEDIVEMFADGPGRLESLLSDLEDHALDWRLTADSWSIRQQVLHLVDLELAALHKLKFALSSPERGVEYIGPSFHQDAWAEGMNYGERPVAAEVQLFRHVREHVLSVCRHVPGALGRSVRTKGGREESAGRLMKMMAGHANVHLRRIAEIRTRHGLPPREGG
ncbi:catechol 2,3-dioxygenase-like lactoylglutathione lyase family enzyme [Paenibacillus mucilaginosus]|uniref:DinB family protein n=1 Tax=Paenibacillus mucilaginosus TaxID=61624 RepID=UPI003D1AC5B8